MDPADHDTEPTDPSTLLRSPFQLGPFIVRPEELRLVWEGAITALQQKEMALLLALAQRALDTGLPMSSAELRQAVWGDQAITDGAAKNLVWQLRNSLGESADAPRLLETVPGAGYRLKIHPSPLARAGDRGDSNAAEDGSEPRPEGEIEPRPEDRNLLASRGGRAFLGAVLGIFLGILFQLADRGLESPRASKDDLGATSEETVGREIPAYGPARTVTGLAGREWSIDVDPSGRHLLFAWSEQAGQPSDLYRLDLENAASGPIRLTTSSDHAESGGKWSADSRQIAFVRHPDPTLDELARPYEIHVMAAAGGSSKSISTLVAASQPHLDWQRAGEALFVTWVEPAGGSKLGRMALDTGAIEILASRPKAPAPEAVTADTSTGDEPVAGRIAGSKEAAFGLIAASPDGDRLAQLMWTSPHSTELHVRDLDSGREWQVAGPLPHVGSLDWSADSRRLLFTSRLDGPSILLEVDARAGSEPKPFPGAAAALDIGEVTASDEGTIVFEQSVFDVDLWAYALEEPGHAHPEPRRLVPSDRVELAYTPAPDGRSAVFLTDRSGALELWIVEQDEIPRPLARDGVAITSRPSWSPDGSLVALGLRLGEQDDLAVIRPQDGHVQLVTDTPEQRELAPAWRADGLALRFTSHAPEGWVLREQELWNPKSRRRIAIGGQASQDLGDGRLLYSHAGEGLYLQTADGEVRHLEVDLGPADWSNWQATTEGVYSVRVGETRVLYYDFESGESREVIRPSRPAARAGLALSADGRQLFVATVERDTSALRVVPRKAPAGSAQPRQ